MTDGAEAFAQLHPVIQHHVVNTLGWPALRPLQSESIAPVLAGDDCVLLAPTAGGKTEAAMLPLLTRMEQGQWSGTSVLYVCPLKALLNNLHPRLEGYAAWLGRSVGLRHGDTTQGARKRQLEQRPSVLLTTPESLEAMLVSPTVDAQRFFGDVRAVVIDEVHAFAGDDRGWHLLAVLQRLTEITERPIQRIGLSATVGNADELLQWLQGSTTDRPRSVVAPGVASPARADLAVDYVGSIGNAAAVVSALHRGEKRLVFADSRRNVESLSSQLREREVDTHVSHSSLSADERRRAEQAFAEARDCVIVSTSTLELGIDVGDLDRVLQVGAPHTVASLLQRLGRTGRRPGSSRNMTFLATNDEDLLRAAGLLLLLEEGYVEPVTAPSSPRHVAAQQLIGLALQKGRIDPFAEAGRLAELGLATATDLDAIARWLLDTGHLDSDSGLAFVGPTAELHYGRRNFMEVLAVFTAPPEVTVLHGRQEIGSIDPAPLTAKSHGPRVITLGGRAWQVTHVDWPRRRAQVVPSDRVGLSRWTGESSGYSYALSNAIRRVLLGTTPSTPLLSERAQTQLALLRTEYAAKVSDGATVVATADGRTRWWTFAGGRANRLLATALGEVAPELMDDWVTTNYAVSLRADATGPAVQVAMREATHRFGQGLEGIEPEVSEDAVRKLKFHEMLPPRLAVATLAARTSDHAGVRDLLSGPVSAPMWHG